MLRVEQQRAGRDAYTLSSVWYLQRTILYTTLFTRLCTGAEMRATTSSAAAASCTSGGRRRTARPRSGSGPCRSRQGRRRSRNARRSGVRLCGKHGRYGRPAGTYLPCGRGGLRLEAGRGWSWPRLVTALCLVWSWRGLLEVELAQVSGRLFSTWRRAQVIRLDVKRGDVAGHLCGKQGPTRFGQNGDEQASPGP